MANGSDFDPILMSNSVDRLTQSVKVLGDNMEDMTNRMVEAMERVKKSVSGVGDEMERTADRGSMAMITKFEGVNKVITGLQRKMKALKNWAPVRAAGAVAGAAGWAGGKAMSGIKGGLGAVGLGSGMGMLSWMMKGFLRPATYAAEGQKVAQMLNQMGGVTEKYAASLGGRLRTMSVRLGREVTGDLKAGLANFAAGGFGEEDVKAKGVGVAISRLKDNALEAAFGLDMFFEIGAGTTAKNAATLAVDMNMSLKDSVAHTQELYVATRNWGVSYGAVIGAVMQTTSALRLMGVERGAVLGAASGLVGGFAATPGVSTQRAGTLAMASLGAMGGAFANMPMGWQAHIGKDVGKRLGQNNLSEIEAIYKMNTGFGGLGKAADGQFEAILGSITNFARTRTGGGEADMYMMLTKGMGFSKEVSTGIIALNRKEEGQKVEGKQRNDILDQIRKAFDKEGKKVPPQVRLMRKLNDTLAKVGGALLMSIVGGFASLYGVSLTILGKMPGTGAWGDKIAAEGIGIMSKWATPTYAALGQAMAGMGEVGPLMGEGASLFTTPKGGNRKYLAGMTKKQWQERQGDRVSQKARDAISARMMKQARKGASESILGTSAARQLITDLEGFSEIGADPKELAGKLEKLYAGGGYLTEGTDKEKAARGEMVKWLRKGSSTSGTTGLKGEFTRIVRALQKTGEVQIKSTTTTTTTMKAKNSTDSAAAQ